MGMKYLFLLISIFISNEIRSQCLQANIVLLVDWSGSEVGNEPYLANSIQLFIDKLPISEYAVNISIVTFDNNGFMVEEMTYDKDMLSFKTKLLASKMAAGGTYISNAMKMALNELILNDRGVRNLIIIISDGDIEDYQLGVHSISTAMDKIPLGVFAVQIGGDENGAYKLLQLTGDEDNIVGATSLSIVEALMGLDMCN